MAPLYATTSHRHHRNNTKKLPNKEETPIGDEEIDQHTEKHHHHEHKRRHYDDQEDQEETSSLSPHQIELRAYNSPFLDLNHSITLYEGTKLLFMLPIVALKIFILAVAVVYSWLVLVLLLLGTNPNKNQDQTPVSPPWRQHLVAHWVKIWASFLLLICGYYRIPVKGWKHIKDARQSRAIIVFNHESYVDSAILGALIAPCGIAKAGVARIPFISTFAHGLQFLFVERKGTGDQANSSTIKGNPAEALAEQAADRQFPLLMIAPEATTKGRPCLLKFRHGAFSAGQPVLPVLLKYPCRHFYPGWGLPWSTTFHLYRLFGQFVNHAHVELLPVYYPSEEELNDPSIYANNVRELMGQRLGVELVDQGVGDVHFLGNAGVRETALGRGWQCKQRQFKRKKHSQS